MPRSSPCFAPGIVATGIRLLTGAAAGRPRSFALSGKREAGLCLSWQSGYWPFSQSLVQTFKVLDPGVSEGWGSAR